MRGRNAGVCALLHVFQILFFSFYEERSEQRRRSHGACQIRRDPCCGGSGCSAVLQSEDRLHLQPVPRLNEIECAEVRRIHKKPVQVLRRFALSRSPIYGRGANGKFPIAAGPAPTEFPITSPDTMSSTRRFCCRPPAVSLEATGCVLPNP
jgi:hypothetical protein